MVKQYVRDILSEAGLKNTKYRVEIIDLLNKSDKLLSAHDIHSILSENECTINLSTVYRTLDKLVEFKIINKLFIDKDSQAMYEYNKNEHHHLIICQSCNKIMSVYNCPLEEFQKEVEERTGFEVIGHKIEFYGYCEKCKKKQK